VLLAVRYYPTSYDHFRQIAHYAVSVRKNSQCDTQQTFLQAAQAKLAYFFISWNISGYREYSRKGQLVHLTLGKIKCTHEDILFPVETERAKQAITRALAYGEDINAYSIFGNTPLHSAVYANNHFLVEYLLKLGADIDLPVREARPDTLMYTASLEYGLESAVGKTATQIAIDLEKINLDTRLTQKVLRQYLTNHLRAMPKTGAP
jgi:hypothetical protein